MEITPQELKEKLDRGEKLRLVDIRAPEERAICHIEGDCFIPMSELEERLSELKADELTILYCHHGIRSANAAGWLQANGFPHVMSLKGGIEAWAQEIDLSLKRY